MGCDNNSCGCGGDKKDVLCVIGRVLKLIVKVTKITALIGLTLVLFDVHTGLKAQFEGMQAQQAMMMNAAAANNSAPAK